MFIFMFPVLFWILHPSPSRPTSPPVSSHLWLRWLPLVPRWFSLHIVKFFTPFSVCHFVPVPKAKFWLPAQICFFYIFRLYPDWFEEVQTAEKLHEIQCFANPIGNANNKSLSISAFQHFIVSLVIFLFLPVPDPAFVIFLPSLTT